MLAGASAIVAGTLSTADEKHQEFGAGVFHHLADRVVHESVKNIDRNHPHFAVASAFGRQINYDRSAGLARSQRRAECAMRVCSRGEDVSEACLRMRTAARAQRGVVLTCACRGRLLCIRWAGGILEVPDVRRERRKIDVGYILISYTNLAC